MKLEKAGRKALKPNPTQPREERKGREDANRYTSTSKKQPSNFKAGLHTPHNTQLKNASHAARTRTLKTKKGAREGLNIDFLLLVSP